MKHTVVILLLFQKSFCEEKVLQAVLNVPYTDYIVYFFTIFHFQPFSTCLAETWVIWIDETPLFFFFTVQLSKCPRHLKLMVSEWCREQSSIFLMLKSQLL